MVQIVHQVHLSVSVSVELGHPGVLLSVNSIYRNYNSRVEYSLESSIAVNRLQLGDPLSFDRFEL
jgi:hypothetical protein